MKLKMVENVVMKKYDIPEERIVLSLGKKKIFKVHPLMEELLNLLNEEIVIENALETFMNKVVMRSKESQLEQFLAGVIMDEVITTIQRLLEEGFLEPSQKINEV